uniref:PNPLA domain-containing protein n=1 Tax=viral metagenome TaxID=1070528 RepID=A0A6C0JL52_9ZZZZ
MSLPFKKLALGGGGAKGILHIGALRELAKYQKLYFPNGVYGTSIGAIIAVFVAFEIPFGDKFMDDKKDVLALSSLVPSLTFETLQTGFPEKGTFTMDVFHEKISSVFKLSGLDIQTLKIRDAKMPLYIISSNITKGVPTIFTGDVTIVDALRCSCALPFVYRPQELYGQLYIDGDAFLPYIGALEKDAFVISLKTHACGKITPKSLSDMSILTYIREVYNMSVNSGVKLCKNDTTLDLIYPNLLAESDLNDFNVADILRVSEESMRGFLISKGLLKEFPEVSSGGLTNHLK